MLSPADLLSPLPDGWQLLGACDTGTYMSAVLAAFCPEPMCILALEEFPNYRYVGGEIELLGMATPEWARWVFNAAQRYKPKRDRVDRDTITLWCDPNTQWRSELAHYGLKLQSNHHKLEYRCEVTREYMHRDEPHRCLFAPWLTILPYEMEHAQWPEDTTAAGKFERLKYNDHTLDCLEHICSRRPRSKVRQTARPETFLQRFLRENRRPDPQLGDPHLGRL